MDKVIFDAEGVNENVEKVGVEAGAAGNFFEKGALVFENMLSKIYKVRCVCCFTSVFALSGLAFLSMDTKNVPDFVGYMVLILWAVGILSAIIACPVKLIGKVIKLVAGGTIAGLAFFGVGAALGFAFSMIISMGMVLFFPCIVSVPYYFKELRIIKSLKM